MGWNVGWNGMISGMMIGMECWDDKWDGCVYVCVVESQCGCMIRSWDGWMIVWMMIVWMG